MKLKEKKTQIFNRNEELCVPGLSEKVVGVLGGGQLGRMLCQAASKMALVKVMVLNPQENCPASSLPCHHMVASFDDSSTVEQFARRFVFVSSRCILVSLHHLPEIIVIACLT